jgi:hypothetical protein
VINYNLYKTIKKTINGEYENPVPSNQTLQTTNNILYYPPANKTNELQRQLQSVELIHFNDIKYRLL